MSIFGGLGNDLCENGESRKSNDSTAFWLHFGILGGLVGGSWGGFWAILATSWALLDDLGVKLGGLEDWKDWKDWKDWPKMGEDGQLEWKNGTTTTKAR